jgi:DNA-binding IclR family transcriptional regulator
MENVLFPNLGNRLGSVNHCCKDFHDMNKIDSPKITGPYAEAAGTQSIRRTFALLKKLAEYQESGLRCADLARLCELQQPTAHRMLKILLSEQMVQRDGATRRYRLGPLAFELGIAAAPQFNLLAMSAPSLRRIAEVSGDTAFLFIRRGNDAVCIDRVMGHFSIQTPVVTVGSRQPLGVNAGGLAILLALSDTAVEDIIRAVSPRLGAYGDCDDEDVRRLVASGRRLGYASIGEMAVPGVTAMGLAITTQFGSPAAALTLAATTNRMTPQRQAELYPLLRQEVETLGAMLYQR